MHPLLCLLSLLLSYLHLQSLAEAKIGGFSAEIFHRDSPLSPFYNHSATPQDLARIDALRSIARSNHFRIIHPSTIDESKIESAIIPNGGAYLMKFSIGSPPFQVLPIADTGSDLVWVQCEPCNKCYPQQSAIFDPKKSSTYTELSCDSKPCQDLPRKRCGIGTNECQYLYTYGSGYTNGVLATETFTFDSTDAQDAAFPTSVFGCGHNNGGSFNGRESGIAGLGAGSLSLISQLGHKAEQKFSYCLPPVSSNSASKLKFGADSTPVGAGLVSTPILFKEGSGFYYLSLEGVSVGNKTIKANQGSSNGGNIIIDSGTTLTMLDTSFYGELEEAVKESISLNPAQGSVRNYRLCYETSSFRTSVPEMALVFHFSGADVTLKNINIFRGIGPVTCLAMMPTNGLNIYGNVAQISFLVGYDLATKKVSFAPADCSQQ